ncbi:hypothetical protein BC829DRAFT_418953 [Chytridium lagenaria]|nr:hypothetical protein BC829DRAFT_418953 [Chytridium lagenaria]
MTTVAVIGTAGRGPDGARMSKDLFERMVVKCEDILINIWKMRWDDIHLVSGGAAWADHIAVKLFLAHPTSKLTLHFPCAFDTTRAQFLDTGSSDWRSNPGRSANRYHRDFGRSMKEESMREICVALERGAKVGTSDGGFHKRNGKVAMSERMVAFTWGVGLEPKDGGTKDTWRKCKGRKMHVGLDTLVGEVSLESIAEMGSAALLIAKDGEMEPNFKRVAIDILDKSGEESSTFGGNAIGLPNTAIGLKRPAKKEPELRGNEQKR